MILDATGIYYQQLNETVRASDDAEVTINNLCGQRYIACGSKARHFTLNGTPGNGLGQYMDGATVEVFGNCQEAVGDTMNKGEIIIHGNCGDACGYGMRGGRILIEGNVGYRAGIHMKAYMDHYPVLVVGGTAGSFLGEYLAGGLIAVLGKGANGAYPARFFCGTGMHGGKRDAAAVHALPHKHGRARDDRRGSRRGFSARQGVLRALRRRRGCDPLRALLRAHAQPGCGL